MKSIKMFGKSVPLLAIVMVSVLFIGASAVLVDYLSNTVTADFEVTSPMLVGVSLGFESWEGESYPEEDHDLEDWTTGTATLELPDILGGETMTIYMMSQNLADAEIKGFEEAIVTNSEGLTGADFVSVVVSVDSIYGSLGYGTEQDLIALGVGTGYFEIDSHILFGTAGVSTWGEGETDVTKVVVTFEEAASGTYTFSYRIVPD